MVAEPTPGPSRQREGGDDTRTDTKTRTRPAAVILTPNAEARVAALMASAPEGAVGVKLSTPRRGCSGLASSVDYVTEEEKFDEKIENPGGIFSIDGARTEERSAGRECVSPFRYRRSQDH